MFGIDLDAAGVQDLLLDHEESPRNRGRLAEAAHAAVRRHPLCGDEVAVTVRVENGRATELRREGRGCVLCRASAPLSCEAAEGRPVSELLATDDAELANRPGLPLSAAERLGSALAPLALRAAPGIRKHSGSGAGDSSRSSCAPG